MVLRVKYDGTNVDQIIRYSNGYVSKKEDGTLVLHKLNEEISIEIGDIVLGPGAFGSGTINYGVRKLQ